MRQSAPGWCPQIFAILLGPSTVSGRAQRASRPSNRRRPEPCPGAERPLDGGHRFPHHLTPGILVPRMRMAARSSGRRLTCDCRAVTGTGGPNSGPHLGKGCPCRPQAWSLFVPAPRWRSDGRKANGLSNSGWNLMDTGSGRVKPAGWCERRRSFQFSNRPLSRIPTS